MSVSIPQVSILMPVYNASTTLLRAWKSIACQTFTDWELVAVDDGSSDGTTAMLEQIARSDARVRTIRRAHGGIVAALNEAIDVSSGPLLARMDADDEMLPERIERQVNALREHPEWALVGSIVRFGGDVECSRGYALHVDWANSLVDAEQIALRRFVESPFAHPSVLFRRDGVVRWGGYRGGDFPEDYEMWLRWFDGGARMGKVGTSLLVWHDPPARLSRTDARYSLAAFYRIKSAYLASELRRRLVKGMPVWAWGAGRLTRRRVDLLKAQGIPVAGYVDIDPSKAGRRAADGAPVILPKELPSPGTLFVLGYVASRGARELVDGILRARGYREGIDYLHCA